MQYDIIPMNYSHFKAIEPILSTNFDDFWNSSILKQELDNPNSQYFVAIQNSNVLGFAGIWKAVDEYHITDIVVRKDFRHKRYRFCVIGKTYRNSKTRIALNYIRS